MQRAERRLFIVVPLALALILSLLYLTFHSLRDALMIFSGVLFARVGGVLGLWVDGPAVHDLGGRRLRGPGRGVDAGRAGARQLPSATGWPTAWPSARPSSRRGWRGFGRCS